MTIGIEQTAVGGGGGKSRLEKTFFEAPGSKMRQGFMMCFNRVGDDASKHTKCLFRSLVNVSQQVLRETSCHDSKVAPKKHEMCPVTAERRRTAAPSGCLCPFMSPKLVSKRQLLLRSS